MAQHFKIREDMPGAKEELPDPLEIRDFIDTKAKVTYLPHYILFLVSSWCIMIFNFVFAIVSFADQIHGIYNGKDHFDVCGTFIMSLAAIMLIDKYIIKRK